jgi:hypothetical protein
MNTKIASFSLLAIVLSLSAFVADAWAVPGGPWDLKNKATWRVLDSNPAGEVYTLDFNGGDYQRWTNISVGSQFETISNKATGRCLDSNSEGKVYALPCNGGANQVWRVKHNPDITGYIYVNAATGLCLDSNSEGKVYTLACNGGDNQRWL